MQLVRYAGGSVCDHVVGGQDQYHCTGEPDELDIWRTALFIAKFHDSPQLRVIGVDGRIGPLIEAAIDQLCVDGWVDGPVCSGGLALAYEVTDGGAGWYRFHHHHLHISLTTTPGGFSNTHPFEGISHCLTPDCAGPALSADPRRALVRPLRTRVFSR